MTVSSTSRIAAMALCAAAASAAPLVPAHAQTAEAPGECVGDLAGKGWLNVEVRGVRNATGIMAITIYDGNRADKFLRSHGSLDVVRVPAQSGTTRACVKLPGNGVYAVAVYHDEDGSRKLTRSGIGLPTEGYGFSNNPPTIASLPTFNSVRLNVPKPGLTARITLKYP